MIFDHTSNWMYYLFQHSELWVAAFKYVDTLTPDTPDGQYQIMGDDVYALVGSGETRMLDENTMLELHWKYCDLHIPLAGMEHIVTSPIDTLETITSYAENEDNAVYHLNDYERSDFALTPGHFLLIMAGEGHAPRLHVRGKPRPIKKAVIKINHEKLLG
jgi:YhcH/YjgK/YiaL family protein